jgi:hypothetical protein
VEASFLLKAIFESQSCAGVGIALCTKLSGGGIGGGATFDFINEVWFSSEDETVNSLSYTFSYATSGEPDSPGRNSTMLLVPSLTIVFTKTLHVVFDKGLCAATGTEITTFRVDNGGDNFKVYNSLLVLIAYFHRVSPGRVSAILKKLFSLH